jgi:hypothetical protein
MNPKTRHRRWPSLLPFIGLILFHHGSDVGGIRVAVEYMVARG